MYDDFFQIWGMQFHSNHLMRWLQKYSHFCSKNIKVFENILCTTVNELVINKLIKLTMLWTTGPWVLDIVEATSKDWLD